MPLPISPSNKELLVASSSTGRPQALEALLELSGYGQDLQVDKLVTAISKAPDPETACQVVTNEFQPDSDVLQRKWRKVVNQTWQEHHPDYCATLDLPLTSEDVLESSVVPDAKALLAALAKEPASLTQERGEWVIDPEELPRLLRALPSFEQRREVPLEHEWACVPLRRLRNVLQLARLVRIHQGQLKIIQARYDRWQRLTWPQQYYVLWHLDVYHVDWAHYAGQCGRYIQLMQNYLPLVWELGDSLEAGDMWSVQDACTTIMDTYEPLWQQERTWGQRTARQAFLNIYEQCALPAVIERLLVNDIFARYGLVEQADPLRGLLHSLNYPTPFVEGDVRWTKLGQVMFEVELNSDLPCTQDVLP